jgi:hypothetical protein
MADRRLKFFNKSGNPLNLEYVDPTGPTPLDFKFQHRSAGASASKGEVDVSGLDTSNTLIYNVQSTSGFYLFDWANEISDFLERGAEIEIELDILPENSFKGKVSSVSVGSSTITINFSSTQGLTLISDNKRIITRTLYRYRPGGYFTGSVFFEPVSAGLYENEQIFVLQEAYGLQSDSEDWGVLRSTLATLESRRIVTTPDGIVYVAGKRAATNTGFGWVLSNYGSTSGSITSLSSTLGDEIRGFAYNGESGASRIWIATTNQDTRIIARGTGTSPAMSSFGTVLGVPAYSDSIDLLGVAFSDANTAVAVGKQYTGLGTYDSVIWRTTNGGTNWSNIASPVTTALYDVKFSGVTGARGIAVGEAGVVLYSSDYGASWSQATTPVSQDLYCAYLLPNGTGWAAGESGVLIRTVDYGVNWSGLDSGISVNINSIHFDNPFVGFIGCDSGLILKSANGGFSWTQDNYVANGDIYAIAGAPEYPINLYFAAGTITSGASHQVLSAQRQETLQHMYPRTGSTGGSGPSVWRTRWDSDNYGDVDVSEVIFTYKIEEDAGATGGKVYPLIVSYPNLAIPVDYNIEDDYSSGYLVSGSTGPARSEALGINVAINTNDLYADVYERKLIVEDLSSGVPEKVLELNFYGEVVGEDERFQVMVQNLGRMFTADDANILRNSDPDEPVPNFLEINEKRKELLLAGDDIYNYIGSYKGLINALKFFGYQDLRIKEYWLNLAYNSVEKISPLIRNKAFLDSYKMQNGGAYTQSALISDVFDNANKGKYRLEQTYGPDADGNYVLDVSSEATLVPSKTYKKTSLFGLYYDLNKVTNDVDEYGYPVVVDAFLFTQEEVLIKLFALKERLKKTYLPLNARIIDITGEGVYFTIYNTRSWTDSMIRSDIESGFYLDIATNPDFGFIEDLRAFSIRPYPTSIQTPLNYNDIVNIEVSVYGTTGGSGGAIYFDGILATGGNPTIEVTAGKRYIFNLIEDTGSVALGDFNFYLTTNSSLSQVDPIGVTGNGTTGSTPLIWDVNPQETPSIYYYSTISQSYTNGSITVTPPGISDFGNVSDPLYAIQTRSVAENSAMIGAISEFYTDKENGRVTKLGDSIQDPTVLTDPISGQIYRNPLGMPVVLELLTDVWLWDEMGVNWSSLSLPLFRVGDFVLVRQYQDVTSGGLTGGWYGTVTSVDYTTGEYTLDPALGGPPEAIGGELLIAPSQEYMMMTWQNIDFSNMIEIEWIISKLPTQEGLPYYFEFRGEILSFYKLAHFLPYTGKYKVQCNVYDAFNAKTTVIKNNLITVSPITIDVDAWTRYRQVEFYDWDQVYRGWESYDSIWEYPAEGLSYEKLSKLMPSQMLDFATYGNNIEEGQSLYVGGYTDPVGATGYIDLTQNIISISAVTSPEVPVSSGTFGFAEVTTSSAHGLLVGENVYIQNSSTSEINGSWIIEEILDEFSFMIPYTLTTSLAGVTYSGSSNDLTLNGNETVAGPGTLKVYVNNVLIGECSAANSLYKTTNLLVASINSLRTYPDYFAACPVPTGSTNSIEIQAPSDTGGTFNGAVITTEVTGSLVVTGSSSVLSGGTGSFYTYTYWNETNEDLPNANLKYWGVKNLDWQVFQESQWEDGYAHSWEDFSYNGSWIGGFEIHGASDGDHILVSTASDTYPLPIGVTFSASSPGNLTLDEVAEQLNNSTDPSIVNFTYTVMPIGVTGAASANTGNLFNTEIGDFAVINTTYLTPVGRT